MSGAGGMNLLNPQPRISQPTSAPPSGLGGQFSQSVDYAGFTPDWAKLISNDAGLLQAQQLLSANNISDVAGRNAAIQRALVQFGSVPDVANLAQRLGMSQSDLQDALGPNIQKLAQENTDAGLSTEARLSQANQDALRQIKNTLNARGLLNSGEAGYQLDRQNLGYRQAESDARSKLLDYISQYQQGYLQGQQQRNAQLAQAYSDAANRQFQYNQGTPGGTATFAFTDASGAPVYRAADGSLYNASGQPYTAPSVGNAAGAPQPPAPPTAPPTPPRTAATGAGGLAKYL